jgi:ribokinase
MNILNFGSLNIDKVYMVDHIAEKGETILTHNYEVFMGGKGLNQSIALQRAGLQVVHAGLIGYDGQLLVNFLKENAVLCNLIQEVDDVCGHAIIQINPKGQNAILVHGGSNQRIEPAYIDWVLNQNHQCEWMIVQNETSNLDYLLKAAKKKGLKIIMNPSPITDSLLKCSLENVDLFIINEIEGKALSGQSEASKILKVLSLKFPHATIVLTLGEEGSLFKAKESVVTQKAFSVSAVDTTAAGDTFSGYFLASYLQGQSVQESLMIASAASAISVTLKGASNSIPCLDDVKKWIKAQHV